MISDDFVIVDSDGSLGNKESMVAGYKEEAPRVLGLKMQVLVAHAVAPNTVIASGLDDIATKGSNGAPVHRYERFIDTWILLRTIEVSGERNRVLHVIKSRGMPHSNQVREFLLTPRGIDLLDVYSGGNGGVGQVREQMAQSRKADGAKAQSSDGRGGIRTGARN
jgi:hypothetical protein